MLTPGLVGGGLDATPVAPVRPLGDQPPGQPTTRYGGYLS